MPPRCPIGLAQQLDFIGVVLAGSCHFAHLILPIIAAEILVWVLRRGALVKQAMLGLNKEQKEQILAHRHVKLVSLARLVQERQELQARLQARPLTPASSASCPDFCFYFLGRWLLWIKAYDLPIRLL